MRVLWCIALAAPLNGACLRETQFKCTQNADCGASGQCELAGFCSFPDSNCPNGRRFGDLSGPFADQCVLPPDGGVDGDAPTCSPQIGTGLTTACISSPPATLTLNDEQVDTDSDSRCQPDGSSCVIGAQAVTVEGTVRVVGSRPLVLLGTNTVTIAGTLDASSSLAGGAGGGAATGACASSGGGGNGQGGAGGGGGSFGGSGGAGGRGGNSTGGAPDGTVTVTSLRAGCSGGNGGSAGANNGGSGGASGGAVYVIAGSSISVIGQILASGAGGAGGSPKAGGGGGGTGGLIGLDAPSVSNAGSLIANGGGGGGGGDTATGDAGGDGTSSTTPATGGAPGGGGGTSGGDGTGGANTTGGSATDATKGGGGGGGGAGIIKVFPLQSLGGTLSPPAS